MIILSHFPGELMCRKQVLFWQIITEAPFNAQTKKKHTPRTKMKELDTLAAHLVISHEAAHSPSVSQEWKCTKLFH